MRLTGKRKSRGSFLGGKVSSAWIFFLFFRAKTFASYADFIMINSMIFCSTNEGFNVKGLQSCRRSEVVLCGENITQLSQQEREDTQSIVFSFTCSYSCSCSLLTSLYAVSSIWHSLFITVPHSGQCVFNILLYQPFHSLISVLFLSFLSLYIHYSSFLLLILFFLLPSFCFVFFHSSSLETLRSWSAIYNHVL